MVEPPSKTKFTVPVGEGAAADVTTAVKFMLVPTSTDAVEVATVVVVGF
jgi:hypothetical protein